MKKITIIFALLLFAAMQGTYAQITIFGNVVDAKDGSSIPGAYVIIKGTNITGTTNSSGNFGLINVPNDATLQVSFIGYKTVELPVENQTRFNITLEQDAQILDDVVVTAPARVAPARTVEIMGQKRDPITLPYSVIHVTGDELRSTGAVTLGDGLVGKIPGAHFTPGPTGLRISYLRAVSSFQGSRAPLYVVDGIQMSDVEWLNIDEIESVTVLRGPQALYGSAGANGVIIITLKKQ